MTRRFCDDAPVSYEPTAAELEASKDKSRATPPVDLTALEKPFGLLDPATQEALRAHEGPYEVLCAGGWRIVNKPRWLWWIAYRVKPAPAREAAAWEAGLVKPLEWDHDGRRFSLDATMAMSSSYNWDGYECCRQEGYGLGCGYIIWPDRIASDRWNLYATFDGLYIQDIAGEEAAKAAAQADYGARILTARLDAEWNAALDKAAQIARGNGAYATAHAILAHKRK